MAWEAPATILTVDQLVADASRTISGIEDGKRRIAVALRRHAIAAQADRPTRQPNLIIPAGTGVGKTVLTRALLKASGLPFVEVNATSYSGTGWAGSDLSSMFSGLLSDKYQDKTVRADEHKARMQRWGVVVLDEFDKWKLQPGTGQRDTGRELQSELLRIAEGDIVSIRRNDAEAGRPFDTSHILFIALGAFEGILPIVERDHPGLGVEATWAALGNEHLIRYGFMEELIGRFSTIVPLPPLTITSMLEILKTQVWPIWVERAADEGFDLTADESALTDLAGQAMLQRIGARSLEPLIEKKTWRAWSHAEPGDRVILRSAGHLNNEAVVEKAARV
jgi:ATP-dependent Clp protease ATP-binding subunit ClpX